MAKCKCEGTLGNTGLPNCLHGKKPIVAIWLQQMYDDTGARNFISTDSVDLADIADLFSTETSKDKRLYPLNLIEDYAKEAAEDSVVTTTSQRLIKIADGIRSVTFNMPDMPAMWGKAIAEVGCGEWQMYLVDEDGNIYSEDFDEAGEKIFGFEFDPRSWRAWHTDSTFAPAVDTWNVSYNYKRGFKDYNVWKLNVELLPATFNSTMAQGLSDITATKNGASSTTGVTVDVKLVTNEVSPTPVEGLVLADFTAYNLTDAASITITSVTEDLVNKGRYALAFSAQTAADVCTVTIGNDTYESNVLQYTTGS